MADWGSKAHAKVQRADKGRPERQAPEKHIKDSIVLYHIWLASDCSLALYLHCTLCDIDLLVSASAVLRKGTDPFMWSDVVQKKKKQKIAEA